MLNRTQEAVLATLYSMANRSIAANVVLVAARLNLSAVAADRCLQELDMLGLVDADRTRLTMTGLVAAVGLRARSRRATVQAA